MPIVKNNSEAYGYNYASLADIVNAGFELPQMRLKPTEYGEYVEYLDDKGEWQTGAKVVVPDMKGSNDAQKYGAAISYARRFTAQLALKIATCDDQAVETQDAETKSDNEKRNSNRKSDDEKRNSNRLDFDTIRKHLDTLETIAEVNAYAKEIANKIQSPTDKQRYVIETLFSARREKIVVKQRGGAE